ncbi:MAG: hypothetical protein QF767_11565, partial [Alphaproteobacteria bacterium]|nr:hypothetical protein [Alphaproteobacteria bacterium]
MYETVLMPLDLNERSSWEKALPAAGELCRASGGTLHLIGKYEHQSLPLSSDVIQGRRILGGYFGGQWHAGSARR